MAGKETKHLEAFLNKFGKSVVRNSRRRLKKEKGSTKLSKTIKYKVEGKKGNLDVTFSMDKYGPFLDKGVSGTKKKQSFINEAGKSEVSPYGYKNSTGHSQPPSKALDKWVVKKGIAPRTKSGKFMARKALTYIIARSIGRKGIKSTSFFQKPFGQAMKGYATGVSKAIAKDIEDGLKGKKK
tara:strand:+ start:486 stop:1031 length:546 start_codon:yes stop_codon:yes gene_type:complete